MKPSIARLREALQYDPDTGAFTWRISFRGHARAGDPAGSTSGTHGYRTIKLDGQSMQAHQVAWALVHGAWPAADVDHINGSRDDNRIANLRDVSRAVNRQNMRRALSRSLSGLLGVSKNHNGWSARITTSGHTKCLGTFAEPAEAHAAYIAAKRQLHEGNTL